jgi:hypothetical protein
LKYWPGTLTQVFFERLLVISEFSQLEMINHIIQVAYLQHCHAVHHDIFITSVGHKEQATPPGILLPIKVLENFLCKEVDKIWNKISIWSYQHCSIISQ